MHVDFLMKEKNRKIEFKDFVTVQQNSPESIIWLQN